VTDEPASEHRRPAGLDDTTVKGLGKVSEALEAAERARGHLYSFHQLTGTADETLQEGVALLRRAGHVELAEEIEDDLVGRNVLPGMWTFQVVEAYDDDYYSTFRRFVTEARDTLTAGERHTYEARLKAERHTQATDG